MAVSPQHVHPATSVNCSMVVRCTAGFWPSSFSSCPCSACSVGCFLNSQVTHQLYSHVPRSNSTSVALNPAKRQYVTQQSSIVQNDVFAVMRNCPVPTCTFPTSGTTINQLYRTYHDYSVTQITSDANQFAIYLRSMAFVFLWTVLQRCR